MPDMPLSSISLNDSRDALLAANINPDTGLATDYLNHFNEMIMLLQLAHDMPDVHEQILDWKPATYREHFEHSTFRDKALALSAYELSPARLRSALDRTVAELETVLLDAQEIVTEGGEPEQMAFELGERVAAAEQLISQAGGIIHGHVRVEAEDTQAAVDALFAT